MTGTTIKQIDIITSILSLDNNAKVTVVDEDVDNLIWHKDYQNPNNLTKEDILSEQTRLQAIEDA
tara:strand:+ start:462 stop:656 length:195 start_codon:yes stop_codon:yes gene_type:complete